MRLLVFIFCAIALFVGGCAHAPAKEDSDSGTETFAKRDAELAKTLPSAPEARQWLAAANHKMLQISNDDAKELVEAAYAGGAVKVYLADARTTDDGGAIGATIVIEMPADKAARKKVFDAEAAWWKKHDESEGSKDEGQKYLEIFTD